MLVVEAAPTATIVIVEDEAAIAEALAVRLRAEGFAVEIAADDHMTKPFGQREFVARVRALLRRAQRAAEPGVKPITAEPGVKPITAGPVTIDPERREVRRDGRPVHLTPTEFDLVHRLALRPGVVFAREQLFEEVAPRPGSES